MALNLQPSMVKTAQAQQIINNYLFDGRAQIPVGDCDLTAGIQYLKVFDALDEVDLADGVTLTAVIQGDTDPYSHTNGIKIGLGAMAENPGCFGRDGGDCYDFTNGMGDNIGVRLYHQGQYKINEQFYISPVVFLQSSQEYHDSFALGARTHYGISQYWSLTEFGSVGFKPDGADQQLLHKLTLAMQATPSASEYWARPSFRFYISQFNWNDEARTGSSLTIPGELAPNQATQSLECLSMDLKALRSMSCVENTGISALLIC